jgi:hypothetical protein
MSQLVTGQHVWAGEVKLFFDWKMFFMLIQGR